MNQLFLAKKIGIQNSVCIHVACHMTRRCVTGCIMCRDVSCYRMLGVTCFYMLKAAMWRDIRCYGVLHVSRSFMLYGVTCYEM